jgi:hypothetical protein
MFRNNFPISRIVGIGVIAISVFIFSLLYEELNNRFAYQDEYNYSPRISEMHIAAIFISALVFTTGVGLIMGQTWARILVIIGLIGCLALWVVGVLLRNFRNTNEQVSMLAFTVMITALAVCVTLLLYNKKILEEFGDTPLRDEYDEAMDSDLMN